MDLQVLGKQRQAKTQGIKDQQRNARESRVNKAMHRIEKIKIPFLINKTEKSLVIKAKRPKLIKIGGRIGS